MDWTADSILKVLDDCAESFTFPVLDNGYVYLASTRLSVYKSLSDWAIIIEVFGFSPRSGEPDTHIYTFSSNLCSRKTASDYVSEEAYKNYIANNPYNESQFIFPVENNEWQNPDDLELLNESGNCILRGVDILLPDHNEYAELGIELEDDRPQTFEFCRYLACRYRDTVLCTEEERRISIPPEMELLLQLEEWNHPDITGGELPGNSKTFSQIVELITHDEPKEYNETKQSNTHWSNWPEAGTL